MNQRTFRRSPLLLTLTLIALASGVYLQGYVTGGHKWGTSSVPYYVNPSSIYVSPSAAISAVQTGAAGWSEQSRANIRLTYAGTTNGSSLNMNNKNEVFFRNSSNGGFVAEAYTWWDYTGRLIDGDVVLYEGSYKFFAFSGCTDLGIYIENVVIHELGHVLGLLHSDVWGATMQPAMQSYCDRAQLTLEADDIAGIESLYPPSGGGGGTNTPPVVSIASPANGASYPDGATIAFSGSAIDVQDGNLPPRWTSNLSGHFATGDAFSLTLPAGTHTITASATDSGGLSGSKQITVTVTANAPPPPPPPPTGATLSATGYKVRGQQKADLTWSGLAAGSVDVYRNGARVATVGNSGRWTDNINGKGGGSYTYKVCDAGTSTCTNQAVVRF